jgi:hypothetical protein
MERYFLFINHSETYSKQFLSLLKNLPSNINLEIEIAEVYNNHPLIYDIKNTLNVDLIVVPSLLVLSTNKDGNSLVQGLLQGEEAFKWLEYIINKASQRESFTQESESDQPEQQEVFLGGLDNVMNNNFSPLSVDDVEIEKKKTMFDELFKVSQFDSCSEKTDLFENKKCNDDFERLQKERSNFDINLGEKEQH